MRVAKQIAEEGRFDGLNDSAPGAELNALFRDDLKRRSVMSELPIGPPVDTTPAQRPGPVVLEGRHGRLEKLDGAHAAALWNAVQGHDHIWTYMSSYGPFADATTFASGSRAASPLEDPYSYAVIDPSGRAVGIATLMEIRPAARSIEVGHIVYSPALQRTPLGTEVQYLLARYAFETLGNRRYEWKCNALNAPRGGRRCATASCSKACCASTPSPRAGAATPPTISMLDSEWPARKAAFERWLAPDNFDADGRQKISLAALNGGNG